MKSILYAGAVLMIGAGIYGFVDYKKTNQNEEFKNMYKEKEAAEPVVVPGKEIVSLIEPVITGKNIKKKIPVMKKTVNKESARTIVKRNRIKKQKKLDAELFSRAPLREYPETKETQKPKSREQR